MIAEPFASQRVKARHRVVEDTSGGTRAEGKNDMAAGKQSLEVGWATDNSTTAYTQATDFWGGSVQQVKR